MVIKRDLYLEKLKNRMNNSLIKVITGLRRSGKSFLLFVLFKQYLLDNGVDQSHIIEIKFDQENNKPLLNHKKLLNYIYSKIIDKKQYYILLDEIQYVKKFEPILIQLMREENVDVYVTGSNSKFLSTDIDTALNGKNDPIHVNPLSFEEFMQVYNDPNLALDDYIRYGGLPFVTSCKTEEEKIQYLERTLKEIYLKDIVSRYRIAYVSEMEDILNVLSSSIGSFVNINNIVNTFKSSKNVKIKWETAYKYVNYLSNAFLVTPVERFDIKGRKIIGANKKYYFDDLGIRNSALNFKQNEISHLFENFIFNQLKNKGYKVYIGMLPHREGSENKQYEIDFIAENYQKQFQIQVCTYYSGNELIQEREKWPLLNNNYPGEKIIVTYQQTIPMLDDNGIKVVNYKDFIKMI